MTLFNQDMEKKVELEICLGTLCFIMGGSAFEMISESLPEDLMGKVLVKGMNCPGYCNMPKYGRAPFVKVNGELIAEANIQKVIAKMREEVYHGANK